MTITIEVSLEDFEAWSGAVDILDTLIEKGLCDQLEQIIENDIFPDGCSDTELNDFLWFDSDEIAKWLGFSDWEDLENDGEEEIEYEQGVTEQECEIIDDFCDKYKSDCDRCPYKDCVSYYECKQRFNLIVNQMI